MMFSRCGLLVISVLVSLVRSQSPISCSTLIQPDNVLSTSQNGQIICQCRNKRNSYTGNLNFAKLALSKIEKSKDVRNVDVIIRDCDHLRLELNFNNVGGSQHFNLRIEESQSVDIEAVELDHDVMERRQSVLVKNVMYFNMRGRIQCRVCPSSQENTGLLNIQMENVSQFLMTNLSASLPLKLTGRHMDQVKISHSTFSSLPWPGVFLHNATRVEILHNFFLKTRPRSISISLGDIINVSHNLLDVGEALKVEQYEQVIIKCNREAQQVLLPATCLVPIQEQHAMTDHYVNELILDTKHEEEDEEEGVSISEEIEKEMDIIVTVLATVDSFGLIWASLSSLLIAFVLLCYCCLCRRKRKKGPGVTKESLATAASLRPDLLVIPFPDEEQDEYSESSRAHLAGDTLHRLPQFVTVQGVRCEPGEDGVVCGSLTLGPSFRAEERTESSDRTTSSNILKQQAFSKI